MSSFPGASNPIKSSSFRRGTGCMWHGNAVTILFDPDSGDHCRAVLKVTTEEAERLAKELLSCVKWNREFGVKEPITKDDVPSPHTQVKRCRCGDFAGPNGTCNWGSSGCYNCPA